MCSDSEQNLYEIEQSIDKVATDWKIDHKFFDKYLSKYPSSDFLIGMKAYYMLYDDGVDSTDKYLNEKILDYPELINSTFYNFAKGLIEEEKGNRSSAEFFFVKAIKLDKNKRNKWVRYELYYFYKEKKSSLARKYLQEAMNIDPGFIAAVFEMSYLLFDEGDKNGAYKLLDKLIMIKPLSKVYDFKGHLYLEDGNLDKAKICFLKAISISENTSSYYGLGIIMRVMENIDSAIFYFNKSIALDNSFYRSHKELAYIYALQNNNIEALSHINTALMYEQNLENYLFKINTLLILKKTEKARNVLNITKNKFKKSLDLDYYEILVLYFENKKTEAQEKIDECKHNYTDEDFQWLKSNLKGWDVQKNQ